MSLSRSRTPSRGRRRLAAAVVALGSAAALFADVTGAAPAGAADGRTFAQMLAQLRACESGGNYAINTGNGYYGAYQFDAGTWRAVGGSGLPHQNTPATQDEMATRLYEQRGWAPWPSCSRSQNLYPVPVTRPQAVAAPVGTAPVGVVDVVQGQDGGVGVLGWALDRDTESTPGWVHVYVDSVGTAVPANVPRLDVAKALGVGAFHGFAWKVAAAPGPHRVCVYAINTGPAGGNPGLGCRDVVVPHVPVGSVDSVTAVAGGVRVQGWALDLDAPDVTPVSHLYGGGTYVRSVQGRVPRPDVAAHFGVRRAYGYDVTVRSGDVCVYAIDDSGATGNPQIACGTPAP